MLRLGPGGLPVCCQVADPSQSGVGGAASLREVLARLNSRGQALIVGHAAPMPVVVRMRRKEAEFFNVICEPEMPSRRLTRR